MYSLPLEIRLRIFQLSRRLSFQDRIKRFDRTHGPKILNVTPRIDLASRASPQVSRLYYDESGCQTYAYAFRCERCVRDAVIHGTCTTVRLVLMDGGAILERSALGDLTVGDWRPRQRCPGEEILPEWFVDCRNLKW